MVRSIFKRTFNWARLSLLDWTKHCTVTHTRSLSQSHVCGILCGSAMCRLGKPRWENEGRRLAPLFWEGCKELLNKDVCSFIKRQNAKGKEQRSKSSMFKTQQVEISSLCLPRALLLQPPACFIQLWVALLVRGFVETMEKYWQSLRPLRIHLGQTNEAALEEKLLDTVTLYSLFPVRGHCTYSISFKD